MKRIVPRYAIMPIVGMLLANFFTYFVTPIWTDQLTHYSFETEIDAKIPFLPIFVIPYILAYLQWITGYLMVARTNQEYCKKIMYGEITAKIIVCILFVCLPTTMTRASIDSSDVCSKIVNVIYMMDKPVNLFPSIHCLESWICFRSCLNKRFFSVKYMVFMGCMTALVFLSTVFIKQHVVLDMLGAILVAEIGAIIVNMMSIKDGSNMALKKSKNIKFP